MKYLIAGLGNIGSRYAHTRHNAGFLVADAFAASVEIAMAPDRHADSGKGTYKGRQVILIKPSTFMNLSGKAARYWMKKEGVPPENLLVVVDDIHLPLGTLRLRKSGGDGGHNGLISIIEELETQKFARLRVGIGGDFPLGYQVDYVLGEWSPEELTVLEPAVSAAVEMVKSFVFAGIGNTMNRYNRR